MRNDKQLWEKSDESIVIMGEHKMLKSYEAIYENGRLNWLGTKPDFTKTKVIVVAEEEPVDTEYNIYKSIRNLKGIVPKPERTVSLEEMDMAVQLEGAGL